MKNLFIAVTAAAVATPFAMPTTAQAQNREVRQERSECARELRRADTRREYNRELKECRREIRQAQRETRRERRHAARDWRQYSRYDYNSYEPGYNRYYADRYYRSGNYYADQHMTRYDRIYRGQNGHYYCRRNDGTTGLIIGGGLGALLGNQINIGGSRTVNTIIGGAAGALLGQAIDRGSLRCS